MNQDDSKRKLKLTGRKVIFYNGPDDPKAAEYGTSLTLDVTEPGVRKQIEDFCVTNNVGKNGDPKKGHANIKEYTNEKTGETTYQFTVKFNEHTKFGGLNGLSQADLGFGSKVNLIINAYEYGKFGGGVAMSASAVIVTEGGSSNADADLAELMDDLGENEVEATAVPF